MFPWDGDPGLVKVQDLIEDGSWNYIKLEDLYPWHQVLHIQSIILPLSSQQDTLLWNAANDGIYTPSKGYNLPMHDRELLANPLHHINWKLFWKLPLPRKILLFIWMFINKAIPTGDCLKSHHLSVNMHCIFCHDSEETMDHLFMHCHFARAIWFGSFLNFSFMQDPSKSIIQWIVQFCEMWLNNSKDNLFSLSCSFIILHKIWEARNNLYWCGQSSHPMQILMVIQKDLEFYSNFKNWS